jgi:TonB family protein
VQEAVVKTRFAAVILCAALASAQTAEEYRKRIESSPGSSLAHYEFGVFLMGQSDLQTAAIEFQAALKGDLLPAGIAARSHEKLGWIFFSNGDMARSIAEYQLAMRLEGSLNVPRKKLPADAPRFVPPHPIEQISADYTDEARAAGLEGAVSVWCEIGADGSVMRTDVTEPLGLGLDQKAIEAVKLRRFEPARVDGRPVAHVIEVVVPFQLPLKQSRWHLVKVSFKPEEGVTSPSIAHPKYPIGAGITVNAIDEGRILGAIGRFAFAAIAFEIDEHGEPRHFSAESASEEIWGHEAINLVRQWKFEPGVKNGISVAVPCVLELVWGPRDLPPQALRNAQRAAMAPVR